MKSLILNKYVRKNWSILQRYMNKDLTFSLIILKVGYVLKYDTGRKSYNSVGECQEGTEIFLQLSATAIDHYSWFYSKLKMYDLRCILKNLKDTNCSFAFFFRWMNYSLSYHKLNLPNLYIQDPTSYLLPGISFLFLFLFYFIFSFNKRDIWNSVKYFKDGPNSGGSIKLFRSYQFRNIFYSLFKNRH